MSFISQVLAQETIPNDANAQPSLAANLSGFFPLILIFFIFYFLLIRPQQKKIQEHRKTVEALKRGDKVIAAGGLIGTITKVEDAGIILVEVAPEVKVRVKSDSVTEVLNRTEPTETKETKADKK